MVKAKHEVMVLFWDKMVGRFADLANKKKYKDIHCHAR